MILEVYPMKTQKSFFEQSGGTYTQGEFFAGAE